MSVRNRRPLLASVVLVGAGLALTACGPDNTDTATGTATVGATATVAAKPTAGGPATAAPTKGAGAATSHPVAHTPPAGGSDSAGGPCDIQNLTIHVTPRSGSASQYVIDVRNTGSSACSLDAVPSVDLGDSAARDQSKNVKPALTSGTMRFTVAASRSAYAVIDLDPSGATTGTLPGINQLNVLADQENMPLANTQNFPLKSDVRVLDPRMSVYRGSEAEALASLASFGK
ncbi:DUF4232 domain-containing protein [Streptomyces sp. CBMA123]|uniref:DUF4232 domain-containing protein n=1 Tax=Streptomyces sp. CBMA123 TaxID=1896313 RepID=UPI001662085E|nr:DUF4232 domain-containing protein [Streptomyces sp. CBMA123]MBD0693252.1 hypothetical protein [Streptomyces sp. CBMA123]